MSDEAAMANLSPGPKHWQMGLVGEEAPQRRSVQLNSVQVVQLSAAGVDRCALFSLAL